MKNAVIIDVAQRDVIITDHLTNHNAVTTSAKGILTTSEGSLDYFNLKSDLIMYIICITSLDYK